MLPESESAKLVVMIVMVMIFIVVMLVMVIGTDRKKTGQPGQAGQTGQTDLTFKLEFPGNLCRTAFPILAMNFIHGMVWITRSTWEERERLSNGLFVGTLEVKGDLDKKKGIKTLQKITSKEEPKMLEWIPNKELPY